MQIASKLTHTLRWLLLVAICLISSCRTSYKSRDSHERDSLVVSHIHREEWQRADSTSIVNLSNLERIGKVWTTWERYDTLGRVIERATSHSEERSHKQDSTHSTARTGQALERHDSTKTIQHSTRATHSTLEREPPAPSLWGRLKWLALGAALGIYVYRRFAKGIA